MSGMKLYSHEQGGLNVLLIPLIAVVVFFFGALGFGIWAYAGMQDYKYNSDQKVGAAVATAVAKTETSKDNEFLEREKEPLRGYKSPSVFGDIAFNYPKTWSVYSKETDKNLELLLNPLIVPGNDKSIYALKVEVITQSYDTSIKEFENRVKTAKVKAAPFRLEKLPSTLGSRFDGEIANGINGAVIVLPLRDKTVKISAESNDYVKDLNTIILPNFTFSP